MNHLHVAPRRWVLPLLSTAIALASAAAAEESTAVDAAPTAAASIDPLFDCYRANSAWGLTYAGKVIARDGQVWTYSRRGKALPLASKEGGRNSYEAADLAAKYEGGTATQQIDAAVLTEHAALIEKAAAGTITSTDTGVRDAGGSSCHAYVFDAATRRYGDVELGSDGGVSDRRIGNDAAEAKLLLDWLRAVDVAH